MSDFSLMNFFVNFNLLKARSHKSWPIFLMILVSKTGSQQTKIQSQINTLIHPKWQSAKTKINHTPTAAAPNSKTCPMIHEEVAVSLNSKLLCPNTLKNSLYFNHRLILINSKCNKLAKIRLTICRFNKISIVDDQMNRSRLEDHQGEINTCKKQRTTTSSLGTPCHLTCPVCQ